MHANAAKQSSPARVAASRANGRLSRGPKTLSGKLRSCSNNRRHGLAGTSLILPNESAADFDTLRAAYIAELRRIIKRRSPNIRKYLTTR